MDILINNQEARVLGCLMEKAMATPEYYPLSLNSLANACNQKSNRDPVVSWNEQTVEDAVDGLEKNGLVNRSTVGRVPKYEEIFTRQHNMVASEAAVLCVLLLRGPRHRAPSAAAPTACMPSTVWKHYRKRWTGCANGATSIAWSDCPATRSADTCICFPVCRMTTPNPLKRPTRLCHPMTPIG